MYTACYLMISNYRLRIPFSEQEIRDTLQALLLISIFLPSVDYYKEFLKYFHPLKTDNTKAH